MKIKLKVTKSYPASSGHQGRPGLVGGSSPAGTSVANDDPNPVIGTVKDMRDGTQGDVVEIKDADTIPGRYHTFMVGYKGAARDRIFGTTVQCDHDDIVKAVNDPRIMIDQFVRFRFRPERHPEITTDTRATGVVIDTDEDRQAAMEHIYVACDTLVEASMPASTPLWIDTGQSSEIKTTFKEFEEIIKEMRRTKSYPATSGHKGRPGQRGGSLPSGATGSVAPKTQRLPMKPKKVTNADPGKVTGPDTMSLYFKDGKWTPERQALHETIIQHFFEGKTPVDNPTSYILGGGPAAGKTTLVKSGLIELPTNMVLAAGDDIKPMLPEYDGGKGAVFCHEESSYLSKEIASRASKEKYNVLMDGTGDTSVESLLNKANSMRASGQPVIGLYVTVDMDTAIQRSKERAIKTGRWVPDSVIKGMHASVSQLFPDIAVSGIFDRIALYDTNGPTPTISGSGEGKKFKVTDKAAYKRFLDKAGKS